jgi:hypothetical protein
MTGTSPDSPAPCCATTPYCGCGRYTRGSLVGDWLAWRAREAWRGVLRTVLRRPLRFEYGPDGGLRVPEWVAGLWEAD